MTRVILLALLLAGCASWELMPEAGAPPRPMPANVRVEIVRTPQADLAQKEDVGLFSTLLGHAWVSGNLCTIEITDHDMPAAEYARLLAHEKRHCAGQQHVIRDGKIIWLP